MSEQPFTARQAPLSISTVVGHFASIGDGVYLSCHDAIRETVARLIECSRNPDRKSYEALAAELTNDPGITATSLELQQVGFTMWCNNRRRMLIWTLIERSEADQPPQRLILHRLPSR
jgi:hypothetical protein